MTWALSGSVYTQSGTDADPGDLADESGASSRFNGLQEVVSIQAGRRIEIDGTLTVDPERFLLRVEDNQGVSVESDGTLNLGLEKTFNGVARLADGTALVVGRAPESWWGGSSGGDCSLLVKSGGECAISGAALFVPSIAAQSGSSLLIRDGRIITQDLNSGQTDPQTGADAATGAGFYTGSNNLLPSTRGFISWVLTTDVYIDGLVIEGGGELIIGAVPAGTNGIDSNLTNRISGIVARGMRVALFPNRLDDIEFSDTSLGGNGNFVDVPIQSHNDREANQSNAITYTILKNERRPGECAVLTLESGVDPRNHGAVSFVREVELSGNGPDGAVSGGRYWMQDSEHEKGIAYFAATGSSNTIAVAVNGVCTIAGSGPTVTDIRTGHYLTVDGNDYRVTNISGSTITVEAPASAIPATENYSFSGTRAGAAIYKPSSGSIVKTYDKSVNIPGSATRVTDDRERKIYSGVLNGSGKSGVIDVLNAAIKVGAERGDPLTDNDRDELTWNLRGKDNDLDSSKFDFHFWHPEYLHWTTEINAWDDTTGILEVGVELVEDVNYIATSTIISCATSADIYAAIKQRKVSSADEVILPSISTLYASYSHVSTEIDFGANNVVLDPTASQVLSVSGDTITIKTDAVLTGSLRTTGTITVDSGVSVIGVIADSTGVRSTVTITANDGDTVAYFLADGTEIHRSTLIGTTTADFNLSPAQSAAGQKVVVTRPGHETQMRTVSTAGGGSFSHGFSELREKIGPDGSVQYDTDLLDSRVDVAFDVSNLNSVSARINIGDYSTRAGTCFAEFESAKTTADGMKYLAFGGSEPGLLVDPVTGDSLYLPDEVRLRRRMSGDSNAGILATAYHPDGTPIDSSNGDIQVTSGLVLDDFAQAFLVDTDIDFTRAGLQSVAQTLTNIRHEVVAYGVGAELTAIVFIPADQAQLDFFNAINPGDTVTVDSGSDLETIFSKVVGVPRIIYLIGAHHMIGDSLRLDVGDENTTFSSANKQTVETSISAAGHWAVRTTTIPGFMLDIRDRIDANKSAIDDGFSQSTFDTRMADVPDLTKDTYKADVSSIPTSNPDVPTVAEIVSGIQSADFEAGGGTNTLAQMLAAISASIGNIPTSNPSVSDIVAGIQAADFEEGGGTDTLLRILADIRATVVDNNSHLEHNTYGLNALKTLIDTMDGVVDANKALLEDGTHGLAALKALIDTLDTVADSIKTAVDNIPTSPPPSASDIASAIGYSQSALINAIQAMDTSNQQGTQTLAMALDSIKAVVDDNNAHLEHSSYGLSALQVLLTTLDAVADANKAHLEDSTSGLMALKALIDTVDTVADSVKSAIEDGTSGLAALQTLIEGISTSGSGSAPSATTIANAVRDLEVVTGLNLLEAVRVLVSIGGGKVVTAGNDIRVYQLGDDDTDTSNLILTVPKFVGDNRAGGADIP